VIGSARTSLLLTGGSVQINDFSKSIAGTHAEQMLLGSDYPLSNDPAGVLKLAVNNVRGSALSEAQKHTICCGNALQLFGLERLRTLSRAATS
jgi:hypothetical protein